MKDRILKVLAAVAAFLTFLGGLDLSGIVSVLPNEIATGFATAFPLLAGVVHLVKAFGDFADDGKINGSFRCAPLAFIGAIVLALLACSCATTTTAPDGTVTVKKPDAQTTATWTELIRDLFTPKAVPQATEVPVTPAK